MSDKKSTEYGIFIGDEIMDCDIQLEPMIDHILYRKDAVFLVAPKKTGKSVLTLQLIFSLTSGQPLFDIFTTHNKYNVLYLQTEGSRSMTVDRINAMSKGLQGDVGRITHVNVPGIHLNIDDKYLQFKKMVMDTGIKYDVIIVDSVYKSFKGKLSDEDVVNDWTTNMRDLCSMHNSSMILVHHPTKDSYSSHGHTIDKGDNMHGSGFMANFCDHIFMLKCINRTDKQFRLTCDTQRTNKINDKITLKMIEPEPLMFVSNESTVNIGETKLRCVLIDADKELHWSTISEDTGLSRPRTYAILKGMVESGTVESTRKGWYRWVTEEGT